MSIVVLGLTVLTLTQGLIEEMAKIQSEIVPLEEFERELAKQYKMVGNLDPVEVQAVAKRAAFYKDDDPEEVPDELVKLDKLNELRRQLAELRSLPEKFHVSIHYLFHSEHSPLTGGCSRSSRRTFL